MARIVLLRLLYLAVVVQPRLSQSKLSGAVISPLLSGMEHQVDQVLQDGPFALSGEELTLTVGLVVELNYSCISPSQVDSRFNHNYMVSSTLDLLSMSFPDYGSVTLAGRSLFTQTSLVNWLFHILDIAISFPTAVINLVWNITTVRPLSNPEY